MEEDRTIKPISTDIKYTTSNLVEFDCIIDTDLSIIEFMLNRYNNSEYFKDEVIHSSSTNAIRNLLLFRENKNPLSILFKDEYIESIDSILEEILSNYKEEIIANSHPTDVFRFIKTLNETDGIIKTRINCSNRSEQELIKKHDSSMFTVLNETDVSPYNCIFIKYLDNIIKYTNLGGKYIFMINARYNLSKDFRPKSISIIPAEYNKIRTIDPYIGLRVPIKTDLGGFNNEK
jgi:hypothetical protein